MQRHVAAVCAHVALFAGNDGGATLYQGSCMMSIKQGQGTGLDVAALSDTNYDFKGEPV